MQRAPPQLCAPFPQQLQRGDGTLARNGLKQGRRDEGVHIRGIRDAGAVRDTPTDEALIMADETEEALTAGERGTEGVKPTHVSSAVPSNVQRLRVSVGKNQQRHQLTRSPPAH